MSKYSEEDFSRLHWRVDKVDIYTYVPVKSFPEIAFYKEFTSKEFIQGEILKHFGKIFAYIIFAYDLTSPYVVYNDNIIKRKKEAILAAGLGNANGMFELFVEDIILNKNDICNRMIIRYLRILKNSDWAILVSYQETLYSQLAELRKVGNESKDVKDIINNTKTLREEISILEQKFLGGDNNDNLRHALYDTIETDDLDITPEAIAAKLSIRQQPNLFNPYVAEKPIEEIITESKNLAND